MVHLYNFFFFSSRRRHTRYIGDWSSDVCSSDLFKKPGTKHEAQSPEKVSRLEESRQAKRLEDARHEKLAAAKVSLQDAKKSLTEAREIGRASCRERVKISMGAG